MAENLPRKDGPLAPRESRLSDDLSSYISELIRRAPSTITFRTGSGRLLRDLLIHWPTLEGWESQAQALCSRIVDAIYPLAGVTYAQAVEVAVTITPRTLEPPKRVDSLQTYAVFDAQTGFEKLYYLTPKEKLPDAGAMTAMGGIAIVGRPLNVFYHTLKDDRRRFAHIRKGMYELPQSMINALYEEPPFISSDYEKRVRESLRKTVTELPTRVARFEERREAVFAPRRARASEAAAVAVPAVTALSALPPPVRAAEHQMMSYAMDRGLSPEFRLQVRRVAQSLRQVYPQAVLTDEARAQLAPRLAGQGAMAPQPGAGPQMAPVPRQTAEGPAPQEPGPRGAPVGLSPVASPIGTAYGTRPVAPGIRYEGPVSPALERRRLSASEQINQPQLPVDQVEPDRAGAPRAGLQPEVQPGAMPSYPVPPGVIPVRPPEPRIEEPIARLVEIPSPQPPRERERRPERRSEVSVEPVPIPERERATLEKAPQPEVERQRPRAEARLEQGLGQGPRSAQILRESLRIQPTFGVDRQAFAVRNAFPAIIAGYLPRFLQERPRNAYETLRPAPDTFPRMAPPDNSGKLQKTMHAQLTQKPSSQPRVRPRLEPWMFPTPSPAPFPRAVRLRGK